MHEKTHYVQCEPSNMDVKSVIYDPNGNALTHAELCDLINVFQDDVLLLRGTLENIRDDRNEFEGPTLDYMQGYRDGQQHLQEIAKLGLSTVAT